MPGDVFLKEYLGQPALNKVRIAKEFTKFNYTQIFRTPFSFTGRDLEEERGHGWLQGIHPDDRVRRQEAMASTLLHQRPFSMEYRLRHHDGRHVWVRVRGTAVRDERGVQSEVEFEMLEGMANHQARAVQARANGLLLYAPVQALRTQDTASIPPNKPHSGSDRNWVRFFLFSYGQLV